MDKFVSESPFKMPPMKVHVTDNNGNNISSYVTPAGFQLERYVSSMYPTMSLHMDYPDNGHEHKDFRVKIYNNEELIGIHLGVYQ